MLINPVEIIISESAWADLEGGILIDSIGQQYRYITEGGTVSTGRTWIDYQSLSGKNLVWVTQSHELQSWWRKGHE